MSSDRNSSTDQALLRRITLAGVALSHSVLAALGVMVLLVLLVFLVVLVEGWLWLARSGVLLGLLAGIAAALLMLWVGSLIWQRAM